MTALRALFATSPRRTGVPVVAAALVAAALAAGGLAAAPPAAAATITTVTVGGSGPSVNFDTANCAIADGTDGAVVVSTTDADQCLSTDGLYLTGATGDVTFSAAVAGTGSGPQLAAASLSVSTSGSVVVNAPITTSSNAPDVYLDGASIQVSAAIGSAGLVYLKSESGATTLAASVTAATTATFDGTTTQSGGVVTSPTAIIHNSAALLQSNAIGTLNVNTPAQSVSVANGQDLTLGTVNTRTAAFTATTSGSLSQASGASITAGTLTVGSARATTLTNSGNAFSTLDGTVGSTQSPAALSVASSTALTLDGVSVPGATLTVSAPSVSRGSGALTAGTVAVTASTGDAALAAVAGSNTVGTLSGAVAGNLSFTDTAALTLGSLTVSGTAASISASGITQTAAATLPSTTLGVTGDAVLTNSGNSIASLHGTVGGKLFVRVSGGISLGGTGTAAGLTIGTLMQVLQAASITSTGGLDCPLVDLTATGAVSVAGLHASAQTSGVILDLRTVGGSVTASGQIGFVAQVVGSQVAGDVTITTGSAVTVDNLSSATGSVVVDAHTVSQTGALSIYPGSAVAAHGSVTLLADKREDVSIGNGATVQGQSVTFGPEYQNSATERWGTSTVPTSPTYSYRLLYADTGTDSVTVGSDATGNSGTYGSSVTFTATVAHTSGSGTGGAAPATPTGTVTFYTVAGTTKTALTCSNTVTLTNGQATCTTTLDISGSPYTVEADYAPYPATDTTHTVTVYAANSGTVGYTVTKADSTVSVGTDATNGVTTSGSSVTITATVGGAGLTPTGTVDFTVGSTTLCSGVTVSSGSAQCVTTALPSGQDVVTATYSGNTRYNGMSGTAGIEVDAAPAILTTSLGDGVVGQYYGQSLNLLDGYPTPTTLTATGLPDGLTADAARGIVGTPTVAGDFSVTLTASNASGLSTSTTLTLHVARTPATVNLTLSPNPASADEAVTATATVTPAGGGTVRFAVDGTDVGSPVTVTGGTAVTTLPNASVGSHTVTATYSGTSTATGATGGATLVVGKAATTTVVTTGPRALVATVSAAAGTPGGTVAFTVGGTSVGSADLDSAGRATLPSTAAVRAQLVGTGVQVVATYAGATSFDGSTGSATVTPPTITATLQPTVPRSAYGWYRGEVTVAYHCTAGSAPVSCGSSVLLGVSGHRVLTRTVTAADGGNATLTTRVDIDRQAPTVHASGVRAGATYSAVQRVTCVGSDALSGIARCDVAQRRKGSAVTVVVVAFDKAGNYTRRTGSYVVR